MTNNRRSGFIAAASAIVVALAIAVPLRAAPPDREVKVSNTPAEAVPVAVQGTPAVTVGNTAAQPLPTRSQDEPALQPVQRTDVVFFASGQQIKDQALFTVPAGKRLVIEEVSVRAQLFTGVSQAMVFLRSTGGGLGAHYVPLTAVGAVDGFGTVLVGTEMLRGYADPGTAVDASITLNTAGGDGARFEVTLTGHLISL
jgi:hypothetical protein